MKSNKSNIVHNFIIGTFVGLYVLTSLISTIHVIDFFELSNPRWMAITLAVAFELGAAASLASIIVLDKMNKTLIWSLFISITLFQMQGNMYYAFKSIESFEIWAQLFDLVDMEPISQKRIMAGISGAILPLIALGFIKSLVDYIKPDVEEAANEHTHSNSEYSDEDLLKMREAEMEQEADLEIASLIDLENMPEFEFEGDELPSFKNTDVNVAMKEFENRLVQVEDIDKPIDVDMVEPEQQVNEVEEENTPKQKRQGPFDPKQYNSFKKVGNDWIS